MLSLFFTCLEGRQRNRADGLILTKVSLSVHRSLNSIQQYRLSWLVNGWKVNTFFLHMQELHQNVFHNFFIVVFIHIGDKINKNCFSNLYGWITNVGALHEAWSNSFYTPRSALCIAGSQWYSDCVWLFAKSSILGKL